MNKQKNKVEFENKQTIQAMPNLSGTKWKFKIAEDCINFYEFTNNIKFKFYSCETEDTYYGDYSIKNDTLYIHEYVTDTDSLLMPNESEYKSVQAKYKLVLKDNKLEHIERWSYSPIKNTWSKDIFDFGDDYLYERVNE